MMRVETVSGMLTNLPCNITPSVPGDRVLIVLWWALTFLKNFKNAGWQIKFVVNFQSQVNTKFWFNYFHFVEIMLVHKIVESINFFVSGTRMDMENQFIVLICEMNHQRVKEYFGQKKMTEEFLEHNWMCGLSLQLSSPFWVWRRKTEALTDAGWISRNLRHASGK